jgi:hypothetical protein
MDEPETEKVVRDKRKSKKKSQREVVDHCLRRALARLPSASAAARRLLPLPAIGFGDVLVMEEENLDWQRFEG